MNKVIVVASGKGGTGKSTTSANVARGLAALGKRTLLVELDFGLRCLDIMLGMGGEVPFDFPPEGYRYSPAAMMTKRYATFAKNL